MRLRVGITISASPAEVWRVIESIERHVEWMADAESISFTGTARRGVGTRFDCVTKIGPLRTTDRMEITEWTPERAMGIEHHGAVSGRGLFTLSKIPLLGTRFTWTEALTFPWWMGGPVGAFAAKPLLRAVWRRNLRRLKQLIELPTG